MNSILHFFLLIVSCSLCSSQILLFTPDAASLTVYKELEQIDLEDRVNPDDMDRYDEDTKSDICYLIINFPFFRDQGYEYADKRDPKVTIKFSGESDDFQDHYNFDDDANLCTAFAVVSKYVIVHKYGLINIKLFGCLAKNTNESEDYPYHEIFVSFGYVFNTFIIAERVLSPPQSPIFYSGIVEIAGKLVDSNLGDLINEYDEGNLVISSRLEGMSQSRQERLCKIIFRELSPATPLQIVDAILENEKVTDLERSANEPVSLDGRFYCWTPEEYYYLVLMKTKAEVFILNEIPVTPGTTVRRINDIPTLDEVYDRQND